MHLNEPVIENHTHFGVDVGLPKHVRRIDHGSRLVVFQVVVDFPSVLCREELVCPVGGINIVVSRLLRA